MPTDFRVKRFVHAGVLLLLACGGRESEVDDTPVFEERVAVYLLPDSAMHDSVRASYSEDDYAVIGDDMMWYRAEAADWLEQNGIRTVFLEGRPTIAFVVDGVTRAFDFSAEPTLDVVVLYQPGQAPLALAPVDVTMRAPGYFGVQ